MSDLIDRQKAIDVLARVPGVGNKALDAVRALPPAQTWTPLTEREPETDGEYLVTFDDGFIATVSYVGGDFELWVDSGEPVAWMGLPDPWKGDCTNG